ncbi:3-hydroxybutyryl-CoA dehydrogenase [Georgenia ruanii]|uniref:3-hydroxybutyryl-CoA dehydrogenase n=2 Tax=Georgenia ruanii TaxID=348442 RepID=A0A7J9UV61_9MICO|nr:3-hydroxybutyryl-CoA dehydrogenase [Georgenia ruanii]
MRPLAHVGVFGGGRMGIGIAHALGSIAARVTIVEVPKSVDQARDRLAATLARSADQAAPAAFDVVTEPDVLHDAELVIEAVPEDAALKGDVLRRIDRISAEAVLASNTSSMSIDALSQAVTDPARFLGLHFFNPVPASSLVEIVVGRATSPEVVSQAQRWVAALEKTSIVVRDSPGFASSRLGVVIALEAMRMVDEGVASIEDIDTAMTLGYRHPLGPLRTTDLVGLDVRLAIARELERELGSRFAAPELLIDKVARGELGRKTGQGFYRW